MHIVLWDTRKLGASKDFAGGYGVGMYPARRGLRNRLIRWFYTRDRRPTALVFAYLAAAMKQLGHRVEYVEDRVHQGADVYIFCPSLITLHLERQAMVEIAARNPAARLLVVGLVASTMPEAFNAMDVTIVKGEAEQLLWRFDEVLARPKATVQLGVIEDLDRLPLPDWSLFRPRRFRVGYDFTQFPTALIQSSRGCSLGCNYCPYIILESATRFRSPESVVDEIGHGVRNWGFRSFKFRDPLFGVNRASVFRLAELIGRLPRKIQFSVESRIELMKPEVLKVLQRVGLTSVTVGIETPNPTTQKRYHRVAIAEDRQRQFIDTCRRLGIRTVAGFMIGFPEDTVDSIDRVRVYAQSLNPTFANFNIVTPYPGTEFFEQVRDRIADFDFSRYTVYNPVLKYDHLTPEQVEQWHEMCYRRYYFRWEYLRANGPLLWPRLARLLAGPAEKPSAADDSHPGVPRPLSGLNLPADKHFRQDGPHHHPGKSERPVDRREAG